jgi:hypothetical protein
MPYWWVNQNQTSRQEIEGGYLWSPKRNANGARNPFYESMREVAPGDLIFSFVDTRIVAIGIAESYCYESPKPEEFGSAGMNWENIGWRVRVRYTNLLKRIRPREHMALLGPLMPERGAPLQESGRGHQRYLTGAPDPFAEAVIALIGPEAAAIQYNAQNADGSVSQSEIMRWRPVIAQITAAAIRSCLTMRPRAVIEEDPDGKHFHMFSWHFSGYDRKKHDAGRCNYIKTRALSTWSPSLEQYGEYD